jgi:hypothetical protein
VFNTPTSEIAVSGCFFHLQKSFVRKFRVRKEKTARQLIKHESVSELGLETNYGTDVKFTHDMNIIGALVFFSPNNVQQGFDDLYSLLFPAVKPLLDYFEDNYIKRRRANGRAEQQFPIELWNMRERTLNDAMRTSNNTGMASMLKLRHRP